MPKTKANPSSPLEKKALSRGGRRAGAGRKPVEGIPLDQTILIRTTDAQKQAFNSLGGCTWLRRVLSANQNDPTRIPDFVGRVTVGQDHAKLPLAEVSVQAGFPTPAENYAIKDIDLNDLLVENPPATFLLRVKGDSMIDAGIFEGDLLVVDRSRSPKFGDIVVMRVNTEFTVKRYFKDHHGVVYLHAENSSGLYPDIHPSEADEWSCFGVVRHVVKSF